MAYQVIARKWRSQSFSELVGQEHVVTTLLNALKSGRMPHALLFTGPRGVGKTSVSRILAKSLRCQNAVDFVPCNKCSDCTEITSGQSIDVIEIDGASNNGVENIRELRETVGYMPSRGKYKIYIVDEVHMLSTSAFNALLKTLEEPPPHVIFIFATTEPQKIPVTILSRTQRFDFRRIPVRKVVERLKTIIDAEGFTAEPQALWLIGRESEGSLRDSQSLLDQVITFCGGKITHKQVVDVLGLTDRTILGDTLKALVARDAQTCLNIIEKVFHLGYDPKQFAQDLLEHLRNLMIVKMTLTGKAATKSSDDSNSEKVEFLDLPDTEIDELKNISSELSEEDVHLLFDMTLKGVTDVVRAQDPRIVLEMLILRLSQAPRLTSIENLLSQMSGGGVSTASPMATPKQSPPVQAQAPSGSPDERWQGLVENIKKDKPLLGAKLEYAALQTIDDQKISIGYRKEQEFFYSQVSTKEVVQQLMDLVGKYWGKPYSVEVNLVKEGGMKPSIREVADTKTQDAEKIIRDKVEAHPMVKEAQKIFKSKITSIKEST